MKKAFKDFYSNEKITCKWIIGKIVASSLSGFIAGLIVAAIIIFSFFDITLKS